MNVPLLFSDSTTRFHVRVWNEGQVFNEEFADEKVVHLVLTSIKGHDARACDAEALRSSIASGEARLLLVTRGAQQHEQVPEPPHRHRGGLPPGALRRVREYVAQRLGAKIDLPQLAGLAGLSVCHFSRAFKQSMGVPPHRFVMRERLAAAAELVRTTNRPLVDIALEVAFSDQSHFTRCFSDMFGDTPRDYRRKHR